MNKKYFNWEQYIEKNSNLDIDSLFRSGIQYPKMIVETITKNINSESFQSIMELGCSAGAYCCILEKSFNRKLKKIGVDQDKTVLDFRLLDEYFCENVFSFSYDEKVDLVFSLGLIEHFSKEDREKLFLKHLELSNRFVVMGFPNTDISLRYIFIKIFDDILGGNKHYRIRKKEIIDLAKKNNTNIIFESYVGNNSFLQKILRTRRQFSMNFFKDYYIILIEKKK
jgi:hypothetical protein